MSVGAALTAATGLVIGCRSGRTRVAWNDVHDAERAVAEHRRHAWRHTLKPVVAMAAVR